MSDIETKTSLDARGRKGGTLRQIGSRPGRGVSFPASSYSNKEVFFREWRQMCLVPSETRSAPSTSGLSVRAGRFADRVVAPLVSLYGADQGATGLHL